MGDKGSMMEGILVLACLSFPLGALAGPFFPLNVPLYDNFGYLNLGELAARSKFQYPLVETLPEDFLEVKSPLHTATSSPVCLSESCILSSADLLKQMDRNVDPCNDFYKFACGGFIANTVLPDHKTRTGSFNVLGDKLNGNLKKVFEAKSEAAEPKIYKGVRDYYQTCMDTESIEERSVADLKEIISRLGGWPVLEGEAWQEEENFSWHKLSIKAAQEGFDTSRIISIGMTTDPKNSVRRIMEVDQFSPGLSREYLIKGFEDKDVQAYYNYMINIAVLLGAERGRAEQEMKEALMLELQLVEFALPREERRNKTALYNPMPLSEVQKMYPEVPLVSYINAITGYEPANVHEEEIVNVAVPAFITKTREHLATVPPRVQANYIVWRNVKSTVSYLNSEALNHALQYSKVLTGKSKQVPRWERCVKSVAGLDGTSLYFYEGSLTNAVGAMYAKKFFPLESKKAADDMVDYVRVEFKKMLDELDWMDPITRAKAHTKADKITSHVAYAKEILDDGLINEFYSGLEMKKDSYLLNILRLKKFINIYYAKEFRKTIDKKDWRTHGGAAIVNAFYNPDENSIQFPAGILGGVFFEADRPLYMNYGAIGFVVGHEITHGFDDQGSQKDGDGNLVDWWEPATKNKYLEKAQCIIDQYGNYTIEVDGETIHVNGINTQGENIADNGGAKEAYRAYQQYVTDQGPEPVLPALGYTQSQLFWLSGASVWCSVYRPAALKNQVLTDPHSPTAFRVNGPFANLPEFAKDWNCPLGSPMNPVKKCSVW